MILRNVHLHPESYLAPNCTLIGSVTLGKHASVFPYAAIRADRDKVIIGENSNIQENVVIHVDTDLPTIIGQNVTIGHSALVHACTIEDNCIIGMHSTILDGAIIGKNSIIGAGAVVSKGAVIPENSVVIGLPGKVKRQANEAELAYNQESADGYCENAQKLTKAGFFMAGSDVPFDHPTILRAQE